LLARLQAEPMLPALARELFAEHATEYAQLQAQLKAIETKLMAWHRQNEPSRRLEDPGIGPIGASLLVMKVGQPEAFRSGRYFAAWIGLTPKDHSTAGKTRLGAITRAGDEALRSVLVVGATAVIQQVRRGKACPWQRNRGPSIAVACRAAEAQIAQARRRGAGQQDGPHRLEADGQRTTLQSRPCRRGRDGQGSITRSAGSDRPHPAEPHPAEPQLAREPADGTIDRSKKARQSVVPNGIPVPLPCSELASRKPSRPALKGDRTNRPDV
jgi:Transposase IS116/IS110/IS902 family